MWQLMALISVIWVVIRLIALIWRIIKSIIRQHSQFPYQFIIKNKLGFELRFSILPVEFLILDTGGATLIFYSYFLLISVLRAPLQNVITGKLKRKKNMVAAKCKQVKECQWNCFFAVKVIIKKCFSYSLWVSHWKNNDRVTCSQGDKLCLS